MMILSRLRVRGTTNNNKGSIKATLFRKKGNKITSDVITYEPELIVNPLPFEIGDAYKGEMSSWLIHQCLLLMSQ